jgi:hypothetical protein
MSKYQAIKTAIESQLPGLIAGDPGQGSGHYERLFLANNPTLNTMGDKIRKGKFCKTVLEDKVNDVIIDLKNSGQVQKVGVKYYPLGFDLSTIPTIPTKPKKAKKVKKVAPVAVEETVVEETQEIVVEETHVAVEVDNPAVIEAHIDTTTNELVENVGGSRDYRKPLDKVEDGYITSSSVQVSTTTLEPTTRPNLLNLKPTVCADPVIEEPIIEEPIIEEPIIEEPVIEESVVDEPLVDEDSLTPIAVEEFDALIEDTTTTYDLKDLRGEFDPCPFSATVSGVQVKKKYLSYRDKEARKWIVSQPGREDLLVIPVDLSEDHLLTLNEKCLGWAQKAKRQFEQSPNHKMGSDVIIRALSFCVHRCSHTDDFGGFVDECTESHCPIHNIWKEGSTHVNPSDS